MTIRVGINGFGRVGRQVLKSIMSRHGGTLEVVAIIPWSSLDVQIVNEWGYSCRTAELAALMEKS